MENLHKWLLEGPPWVEYRARLDLAGQSETDQRVIRSREALIAHPQVHALVTELTDWPGSILNSHKSAGHPLHKLVFLADLGLKAGDPGMGIVVERILEHQDPVGPFQVLMNISPSYGGTGKDLWAWALCDAPLTLYALVKFGLGGEPQVQRAVEYLAGLVHSNGWPCAVSAELGKFRGPGRKDDPCPYANLIMLKMLALLPEWQDSQTSRTGAESLLHCWEERLTSHPYMFYMGTDFCKLKAPLVWFDILHVVEVLRQFPWLHGDSRLTEMTDLIKSKSDTDGRFISRIDLDGMEGLGIRAKERTVQVVDLAGSKSNWIEI